jgi:pSer/pThr/pTyr-binding forkhead associated (FHA) protein
MPTNMNDTTETYQTKFYFVASEKNFSISGNTTIGRSKADLIIDDKALSSIHCQLTLKGIKLFITDLGSTNGTFVNGKKIDANEEIEVLVGDKVRFGTFVYTVKGNINQDVEKEPEIRPKFNLKLILSFFKIGLFWKILYCVITFLYLGCVYLSTKPNFKNLPQDLSFFNDLTNKNANLMLMYVAVFLFFTFLFHAYISQSYFKASKVMRIISFFGIFVFQTIMTLLGLITTNTAYERYIKNRTLVMKSNTTTQSQIMKEFEKNYEDLKPLLPDTYKKKLDDDYKKTMSKTVAH